MLAHYLSGIVTSKPTYMKTTITLKLEIEYDDIDSRVYEVSTSMDIKGTGAIYLHKAVSVVDIEVNKMVEELTSGSDKIIASPEYVEAIKIPRLTSDYLPDVAHKNNYCVGCGELLNNCKC